MSRNRYKNLTPEQITNVGKTPEKLEKRILEIEKNKLSGQLANYEKSFRVKNGKNLDDNNEDKHKTFKI